MHKKSDSFKLSKILAIVLIASLSIITTHPSFTTAQDIPEEITTQENPYKDAFFGSFDKDVKKGKSTNRAPGEDGTAGGPPGGGPL